MNAAIWFTPWLRRKYVEQLRADHVARWAYSNGEDVLLGWCSSCGAVDHPGVVVDHRLGTTRALVRFACVGLREVGTIFLRQVPRIVLVKSTNKGATHG